MKKIFSAFMLMTMMVFSVGSFVSCSDLESEIAKVDTQATTNAEAIADLNSKVAALQTALSAAQADADAAMDAAKAAAADAKKAQEAGDAAAAAAAKAQAEAEAAKAAAAQAKADAIAEATKQVEAIQEEVSKLNYAITNLNGASEAQAAEIEALQGQIAALQTEAANHVYAITNLTGQVAAQEVSIEALQVQVKAMEATLVKYGENLAALGLLTDDITAAISQNVAAIQNLSGRVDAIEAEFGAELDAVKTAISQNVGSIQNLKGQLDALEAQIDGELNTLEKEVAAIKASIAEQVSEALAEYIDRIAALENRIQSVAWLPQSTEESQAVMFTVGKETTDYIVKGVYQVSPVAAAADLKNADVYFKGLSVKAEAPVRYEANVLSIDEANGVVEVLCYVPEDKKGTDDEAVVLALAIENEAGVEITSTYKTFPYEETPLATVVSVQNNTHAIKYNTPIADSKVDLINSLEFVVDYAPIFDETPLAEALAYLGMEDLTIERTPANRFGKSYIEVVNYSEYDPNVNVDDDEFNVLKETVSADKKNVTAEFAADYAKVADATKLVGKSIAVTLKEGFFTLGGDKLDAVNISYTVSGDEKSVVVDIDDIESAWLPVAKFIDVPYSGVTQEKFGTRTATITDAEGNEGTATLTAASHDDMTVVLSDFAWPETTTTYTVAGEWSELDTKTMTTTVYSYEFTMTLDGRPADVEYATDEIAELTLSAAPNAEDPTDTEDAEDSEVVVGAIVTDLAADYASYYEEGELVNEIAGKLAVATWTVNKLDIDTDEVGAAITLNVAPVFTYVPATEEDPEESVVVFGYNVADYTALKGQTVQLSTKIDLNGVNYTVTTNVEVSAWAVPAVPGIAFEMGKYNPQTLKGTNPFTWTFEEGYWTEKPLNGDDIVHTYNYVKVVPANGGYTPMQYSFGGNALKLGDYVKLVNVPSTVDLKNYTLRIKMTNAPYYTVTTGTTTTKKYYYNEAAGSSVIPQLSGCTYWAGTPYPLYKAATADANAIAKVDATDTTPELNYVPAVKVGDNTQSFVVPADELDKLVLNWNGSRVNEIKLQIELVAYPCAPTATANIERIKALTSTIVTFKTDKAIKNFEVLEAEAYEYVHGQELKINLAKHIKVTDLFDKQVNNPYASKWANCPVYDPQNPANINNGEIWANYGWKEADSPSADNLGEYVTGFGSPVIFSNFFALAYRQTADFVNFVDEKNVDLGYNIKNDNGFVLGTDYTFENGIITLDSNLANISRETTFTVRVKFTHMHDGFVPQYYEIPVKVKNAQ